MDPAVRPNLPNPSPNFVQRHLIPADSQRVRQAMTNAKTSHYRLQSMAYGIQALALTILHAPHYVVDIPCNFVASLLNGRIRDAFYKDVGGNLLDITKSVIFVPMSVFFVVAGLIMPKGVYSYFAPPEPAQPVLAPQQPAPVVHPAPVIQPAPVAQPAQPVVADGQIAAAHQPQQPFDMPDAELITLPMDESLPLSARPLNLSRALNRGRDRDDQQRQIDELRDANLQLVSNYERELAAKQREIVNLMWENGQLQDAVNDSRATIEVISESSRLVASAHNRAHAQLGVDEQHGVVAAGSANPSVEHPPLQEAGSSEPDVSGDRARAHIDHMRQTIINLSAENVALRSQLADLQARLKHFEGSNAGAVAVEQSQANGLGWSMCSGAGVGSASAPNGQAAASSSSEVSAVAAAAIPLPLSPSSLANLLPSSASAYGQVVASYASSAASSITNVVSSITATTSSIAATTANSAVTGWQFVAAIAQKMRNGYYMIIDGNHPSKEHKYRLALQEYGKILGGEKYKIDLAAKLQDLQKKVLNERDASLRDFYSDLSDVISALLVGPSLQNIRNCYKEQFVEKLRKVCLSPHYVHFNGNNGAAAAQSSSAPDVDLLEYSKLIRTICYVRWSELQIFSYLKGIVKATTDAYQLQNPGSEDQLKGLSAETLPAVIQAYNHQVKNAPREMLKPKQDLWKQQFSGEYLNEDFTKNMNLPHVRSLFKWVKDGVERLVTYARHGSPTMHDGIVVADYEVFLEAAHERNEKVLYCVHQRILPKVGDESVRVKNILALQARHPNFHAFVQSLQDRLFSPPPSSPQSSASSQPGAAPQPYRTFADFKREIKNEFTVNLPGEKKTCRLPDCYRLDKDYARDMDTMLDNVHRIFFSNRSDITDIDEQRTFLLLFYAIQKMDLKMRLGITHYTTPCKDFLDRGGLMAFVEERLHDYMIGCQDDPGRLDECIVNTIGPPILVKKMEMIPERLEQAAHVDAFLNAFVKDPTNLQNLRAYDFGGWKPAAIVVEKRGNEQLWPEARAVANAAVVAPAVAAPAIGAAASAAVAAS